jgi:hypothetical protein
MTQSYEQRRTDLREALMKAGELGRQEGRLEGALETLVRQATRRFGPIPEETRKSLAVLSEERLLYVAERFFELENLEALARQAWMWNPSRLLLAEIIESSMPLDEAEQAKFEAGLAASAPDMVEVQKAYREYFQEQKAQRRDEEAKPEAARGARRSRSAKTRK